MKNVIAEILKLLLFLLVALMLLFKLRLKCFLKEYRGEEENMLSKFARLIENIYSPFFKLKAQSHQETKSVSQIMLIKKTLYIVLLIFWVLALLFLLL